MAFQSLPIVLARYVLSQIELSISNIKLLPSMVQLPILELKTLQDHLKYVYVGDNETLPVTITNGLSLVQEERLIQVF